MITVRKNKFGAYILELDTPERVVIAEIAVGFSIPIEDAVAAILYRGMDSIGNQLKTVAGKGSAIREHEARKATEG